MYCSECGEKIDGMNFCPNCGHMVTEAEKKAADFAGKAEGKKGIEEGAAAETEKKLSKAVMATARRKRKGKKKIVCGGWSSGPGGSVGLSLYQKRAGQRNGI